MDKLRNLIVFFIKNFPRGLKRTELVKLVYLFEYGHVQNCGCQYSGVEFIRYRYGPFAQEIINEADGLIANDILRCTWHPSFKYGKMAFIYSLNDIASIDDYCLPEWEKHYALSIIDRTKSMSCEEIIKTVYSTPPMVHIINYEKQLGHEDYQRRINMTEGKKSPKRFTKEELEVAKKQLDASPDRGTKEDYYQSLLETYNDYEDFKRRANICLLQN